VVRTGWEQAPLEELLLWRFDLLAFLQRVQLPMVAQVHVVLVHHGWSRDEEEGYLGEPLLG